MAESVRAVGLSGEPLLALLRGAGLRTALDLQLLKVGGEEAAELMEQLRIGGISIGDRSKVRLLFGDPTFLDRPSSGVHAMQTYALRPPRKLQQMSDTCSSRSDELSTDTIAIVLSVLVGAAGYLVQVRAVASVVLGESACDDVHNIHGD
eukprot:SAG31_NODE_9239_length_1310_cov_1.095789_1_plen_150_part_00